MTIRSRNLGASFATSNGTSSSVIMVPGLAGHTLIVKQINVYNGTGSNKDIVLYWATDTGTNLARVESANAVPTSTNVTFDDRYYVIAPGLSLKMTVTGWTVGQAYPQWTCWGVRLPGVAA